MARAGGEEAVGWQWGAGVEAPGLRELAVHLRAVAAGVEVRRAALGPASLACGRAPAADGFREQVAARRALLR